MKTRRALVVASALAAIVQVTILGAAYALQFVSSEKMMARWLLSENLFLEQYWFSWEGLLWQTAAFLVLAGTFATSALLLNRHRAWFATFQTVLAIVLVGAGAWVTSAYTITDTKALYAIVVAIWIALAIQLTMTWAAVDYARRRAGIGFLPKSLGD